MINQSKTNDAVTCFQSGFNCAQAILSTYCEEFGMDKETALKVACGLGGGMGHLQGTCGAVTGAYLLISLKYGNIAKEDNLAKEKTHALVREFARLFEEKNKTTNCLELLSVDIINGDKQIVAEKFSMFCPKIVQDAAEIIENILF